MVLNHGGGGEPRDGPDGEDDPAPSTNGHYAHPPELEHAS